MTTRTRILIGLGHHKAWTLHLLPYQTGRQALSLLKALSIQPLSLGGWMRAEGLVMIEEPGKTTANPVEQRAEPDCSMGPTDFTYPSLRELIRLLPIS
jgi:hypothetical protein